MSKSTATINPGQFHNTLLAHHAKHARPLPWRKNKDPYRIWLSEIMLQQTTVATVIDYYHKFLHTFPNLKSLATATEEEVMHLWQGLGYYSRARNLHKCAKVVLQTHNGAFPQTQEELIKLPGIGPYTSAAISAIAFNQPSTVVDGNVERVISRLFCIETPLPESKKEINTLTAALTSKTQAGDFAEAMMDLGATICTPKAPKCGICPVASMCQGKTMAEAYPKKSPKKAIPKKAGEAYIITNSQGQIYLEKRPEKGLLANLWQVPNKGGLTGGNPLPRGLKKGASLGKITHTFTHFSLEWEIFTATAEEKSKKENFYDLKNLPPTPTLIKKVLAKIK